MGSRKGALAETGRRGSFGVMFHHFCGEGHPRGQGAISQEEFGRLLEFVGLKRIRPADEWLEKAAADRLADGDLCLTFDDNLLCQWEIALPVLEALGLTAFWFIYTSPLTGVPETLEIYRYFRTVCFESVDDFYEGFLSALRQSEYAAEVKRALDGFDPDSYLAAFPFYSSSDRLFRYLRDRVLGPDRYERVMEAMIESSAMDREEAAKRLWMSKEQIAALHRQGHVIGLHSHTHPTRLADLPGDRQSNEYRLNLEILTDLTGQAPLSVSHPCNSYNQETLDILSGLGIRVGFSTLMEPPHPHRLARPRLDHALIMRELREKAGSLANQ